MGHWIAALSLLTLAALAATESLCSANVGATTCTQQKAVDVAALMQASVRVDHTARRTMKAKIGSLLKGSVGVEHATRRSMPPRWDLNQAASKLWQHSENEPSIQSYVQKMQQWGRTLHGLPTFTGTVFYPFAGGDAVNALSLFPNAHTIMLGALIQVGDCQPSNWPDLESRAAATSKVLANFASFGYLGTGDMETYLNNNKFGITPIIMASLHNMGQEIVSVDCGLEASSFVGAPLGDALKITFQSQDGSGPKRQLIYANVDLLTPSQKLNGLLSSVRANAPVITMMKSASYYIRRKRFGQMDEQDFSPTKRLHPSALVQTILDNSVAILQDDTGLRFSCLAGFNKTIYGEYVGPANLVDQQIDIASDYDDSLHAATCLSKSQPLPVNYGYTLRYKQATSASSCPSSPPVASCAAQSKIPVALRGNLSKASTQDTNGIAILAWKV